VQQIVGSPRLPEIIDELQARLADERVRREKFYEEITEDMKAEFINGEVVMHSPAKVRHLNVRDNLQQLLRTFVHSRKLGWVTGEKALCVFPRNDYEPDVCFFGPGKAARLRPEQLRLPPPDFIAEVLSESTAARDRGEKFEDFQAHGVEEYWIVDPDQEIVEQYLLKDGAYVLAQKSGTGEVRSRVVAGFCVPVRALFDAEVHHAALRELLLPPTA
jgi:Uma2 family endonuclease